MTTKEQGDKTLERVKKEYEADKPTRKEVKSEVEVVDACLHARIVLAYTQPC